jgi:hypothetical protein
MVLVGKGDGAVEVPDRVVRSSISIFRTGVMQGDARILPKPFMRKKKIF